MASAPMQRDAGDGNLFIFSCCSLKSGFWFAKIFVVFGLVTKMNIFAGGRKQFKPGPFSSVQGL